MSNACNVCGENGAVYLAEYVNENGEKIRDIMCFACITEIRKQGKSCQIIKLDAEQINKDLSVGKSAPVHISTGSSADWTKIFKTVNIILLVSMVVSGLISGAIMFEEMFDGGFLLGAPIGALAGLLAGGVTVSFSMVIVEISQKLSALREGQKKQIEISENIAGILEELKKQQ